MSTASARSLALKALAFLALMGLSLMKGTTPALAGQNSSSPGEETGDQTKGLSLDDWRSLKKAAGEIYGFPEGPERIAKCEAFLKENPAYPDPAPILRILVTDYLKTPGYNPAYAAQLLERMVGSSEDNFGRSGLSVVEQYYLEYNLPTDSAQRILDGSRQALEKTRSLLPKEADPEIRFQMSPESTEFRLLLDEGRVLLQGGDAKGALRKFTEAEAKRKQEGSLLHLQDVRGKELMYLPSWGPNLNWLYLSMAEAHARLGERAAALQSLTRVGGSGGAMGDIDPRVEKLRTDLNIPRPAVVEVRGEAIPAPDFTAEDLEGNKVSLSDYAGKVVLVMLWTTW